MEKSMRSVRVPQPPLSASQPMTAPDEALGGRSATSFVHGSGALKSPVPEVWERAMGPAAGGCPTVSSTGAEASCTPAQEAVKIAAPARARAMVALRDRGTSLRVILHGARDGRRGAPGQRVGDYRPGTLSRETRRRVGGATRGGRCPCGRGGFGVGWRRDERGSCGEAGVDARGVPRLGAGSAREARLLPGRGLRHVGRDPRAQPAGRRDCHAPRQCAGRRALRNLSLPHAPRGSRDGPLHVPGRLRGVRGTSLRGPLRSTRS